MTIRNGEALIMTNAQPSLFARPDTFFGVCEGLGDNLGIHPNLFRVAFGMAFFFAPLATLATYFLLGLVVAATHYALPIPAAAPLAAATVEPIGLVTATEADEEKVALAA